MAYSQHAAYDREFQQDSPVPETTAVRDKHIRAVNVVWFVYGVIAVFLAFEFVLKLFAANPTNGFVNFIYNVAGVFSAPFDSMFQVRESTGQIHAIFQPSILVAIGVYALLAYGITKLLTLNRTQVR